MKSLPFPRMCPTCRKKTVQSATIAHVAKNAEGGIVEIPDLKVGKCFACGAVYFDLETDAQITTAFGEKT